MNDEQFEATMGAFSQLGWPTTVDDLRARDTAQREALARVEAERDAARSRQEHTQSTLRTVLVELQSSQAQLAEAVGLLKYAMESSGFREILTLERDIAGFLARHAQAEQQEACEYCRPGKYTGLPGGACENCMNTGLKYPEQQEAQGAQAGDGRHCRSCGSRLMVKGVCSVYCPNKNCERDRAALATQPAVPSQDAVTVALARRLLWIAYVWNDHNFDYAHREARREAEKHGITNLDEANAWLAGQPAVRGADNE